jgi:histidine triad (HIT) family protein
MSRKVQNPDCVFCKIINGEIPSKIVYRDEDVIVFPDINPLTPVHFLVIPIKHITSLSTMVEADTLLAGKMIAAANKVAKEQGIDEKGYRLTINSGADAGQVVPHLHMHLMGGRPLRWDN